MKKQRHSFSVVTNVQAGHGDHCHTDEDIYAGCELTGIDPQTCNDLLDQIHETGFNHCPTLKPCEV